MPTIQIKGESKDSDIFSQILIDQEAEMLKPGKLKRSIADPVANNLTRSNEFLFSYYKNFESNSNSLF